MHLVRTRSLGSALNVYSGVGLSPLLSLVQRYCASLHEIPRMSKLTGTWPKARFAGGSKDWPCMASDNTCSWYPSFCPPPLWLRLAKTPTVQRPEPSMRVDSDPIIPVISISKALSCMSSIMGPSLRIEASKPVKTASGIMNCRKEKMKQKQ